MTKLRRAWRRVRALSWGQRGRLAQAWLLLPLVALGLRLFGFRRVHGMLKWPGADGDSRDDLPAAQAVAQIVQNAAAWSPIHTSCLTRSLVLYRMLRRQGLGADVCIGVRRAEGCFGAHAWVEHQGTPLTPSQPSGTCYAAFEEPLLSGNHLTP